MADCLHPSHRTRYSDASTYDEICVLCGATDVVPGGWGALADPCPATDEQSERLCIRCHRRLDLERRIETKEMTSMLETHDGKFRHAPRCVLTEEQALEVKRLRQEGWSYKRIGDRYNVTAQAIFRIVKGKSWKHLS